LTISPLLSRHYTLGSLHWTLSSIRLSSHLLVCLAGLSMSIAARNMRSAKSGVAGGSAELGHGDARRPRILPSWRFAEALWRRGDADECVWRPILSRPSSTDDGRIEKYVVGGSLKRMKLSVRAGQSVTLSFLAHRLMCNSTHVFTRPRPEQTFPAAWPAASAMELRK
jgi:hypothetical protein